MRIIITVLFALFPSLIFADPAINVQVQVSAPSSIRVWATGFSVEGKGRGSLGRSTSKTGPVGSRYFFGIKAEGKISCGHATLRKNSIVYLIYNGKICRIKKIVSL